MAAVPWQQPVLLSVTSGEEENWDMMCQRAEQAASGTDMGSLCDLGATKWRIRVLPGQLRDGGERGFPMFWKGDGRERSTAASWAYERENEGGKVETSCEAGSRMSRLCLFHIPHPYPHTCNRNPWPGDEHTLLPFLSTTGHGSSPHARFL